MNRIDIDCIILQIRKGNKEADELLFKCLENQIRFFENKVIYGYRINGIERDDIKMMLYQITKMTTKLYEFNKGNFFAFWKITVQRKLKDFFEKNKNNFNTGYSTYSYDDNYLDTASENPLGKYILHDSYNDSLQMVEDKFSSIVSQCLRLYSEGYSHNDIADKLSISYSQVTYYIREGIAYLRKILLKKQ